MSTPVCPPLDGTGWRDLLASVPVGRLGFTMRALPEIRPVPLVAQDEHCVVTFVDAETSAHLRNGTVVVLEVDDWDDERHRGWAISLVGICAPVPEGGMSWTRGEGPVPWSGDPGGRHVAVEVATVRCRWVPRAAATGG